MSNLAKQISLTKIAFVAIVLILGINFIFVRLSNRELPPFWGASLRFLIASSILFWITLIKNIPLPNGKDLSRSVLYGILSFGANSGLLYWGLLSASSGIASIIYATVPLTTLLVVSRFKAESLTARNLIGALSVILGVSIVFHDQVSLSVPTISLLALLLASVCAATSGVVIKQMAKVNTISTNMVGMASGSVVLLFLSLFSHETISLPTLTLTWLSLIWLILSSTIAFLLMVWIISRSNPSKVSYTSVLAPIVTIAASSAISHETISPTFLLGSLVVLVGASVGIHSTKF